MPGLVCSSRSAFSQSSSSGAGRVGVTVAFGCGDACGALARSIAVDIVCSDVTHKRAALIAESARRACKHRER